jgi:hypothetical protein
VGPHDDPLQHEPRGQTDLATPLLDALAWAPDLVIIVSDGFDNDPTRGAGEVCRVFRTRLDPDRRTTIVHINPVFDAPHLGPKPLDRSIPTVGLRDAEDLATVLAFARFADGGLSLTELEDYLRPAPSPSSPATPARTPARPPRRPEHPPRPDPEPHA